MRNSLSEVLTKFPRKLTRVDPGLEALSLNEADHETLAEIAHLRSLTLLKIEHCTLQHGIFKVLADGCPKLHELHIIASPDTLPSMWEGIQVRSEIGSEMKPSYFSFGKDCRHFLTKMWRIKSTIQSHLSVALQECKNIEFTRKSIGE